MILSRSNLKVVEVTDAKGNAILNNVHIEPDGTTAASNGRAIICVSPVTIENRARITFLDNTPQTKPVNVAAETVKDVLKNMPPDKTFGGLLEHTDFADGSFSLTDSIRKKKISAKVYPRDYFDYKEAFRKATKAKSQVRVVLNRKRLIEMLQAIDNVCQDGTGEAPVFIEFTDQGDILLRAQSLANDQRALAYMTSYKEEEGKWLEANEWERGITGAKTFKEFQKMILNSISENTGIAKHLLTQHVPGYKPAAIRRKK